MLNANRLKIMNQHFQVVYEDNHLIIVNKSSGVLVQGDETGDKPLLDMVKEYIKEQYGKPGDVFLGTVHRIDRPVSGLVVFARTSKALERMNELFRRRDVHKTYWAVVKQRPAELKGKLIHWLIKDEKRNVTTAYDDEVEHGFKSELTYQVLGKLNDHYLLEVNPITGRPHQIRAQLAKINSPIRGDIKYGFSKPNPDASINLHARKLYFTHPVKKEPVICVAGLPENPFWEQFLTLEKPVVKDKNLDYLH
jgi:23S rRNA pseudouridine1911/1915/1917 synthase